MSTRAPIGHTAVATRRLCFNQGCKALIPRSTEDSRYWRYVLTTERAGLNSFGRGSTYAELSTLALKDYPVEWPAVETQRSIADFLDAETSQLDALTAEKERFVELLLEKRAALITHAVTKGLDPDAEMKDSGVEWLGEVPLEWEVLPLRRRWCVVDCKHRTVEHFQGGIPMISIGQVQQLRVDLTEARQAASDDYADLIEGGRKPSSGDVVYSRNASVGLASVLDERTDVCLGQDVCMIQPSHGGSGVYLAYMLRSSVGTGQLEALQRGSTFNRINVETIRALLLPFPPLPEQRAIADYLDRETALIDELVDATRESIALLKEYRSALISAAVTGKIDVSAYATTQGDSQ